eukprot:2137393-Heterocapsa_arctica.AAC.1
MNDLQAKDEDNGLEGGHEDEVTGKYGDQDEEGVQREVLRGAPEPTYRRCPTAELPGSPESPSRPANDTVIFRVRIA